MRNTPNPSSQQLPVDHDAAVAALAQARGIDLATISRARYIALSIEVRSLRETGSDVLRVTKALGKRVLHLGQITQAQKAANAQTCKACPSGKYFLIRGTLPACRACNCTDALLDTKLGDSGEYCPLGHWDNRVLQ